MLFRRSGEGGIAFLSDGSMLFMLFMLFKLFMLFMLEGGLMRGIGDGLSKYGRRERRF